MLSSALIGCFTARLISVAHTANRSLLSGVNDGEIIHRGKREAVDYVFISMKAGVQT